MKYLTVILVILLLGVCTVAFAHETGHDQYLHIDSTENKIAFTEKERNYVINKGTITMCTDPRWMPYEEFDSKNNYIGVAADYHKMISHLTGLKYNIIHSKSWAETIEMAKDGKCDILSILNNTPERSKYLDFTAPYIKSPSVFVTRSQDKFINGIDDLKGKTLAIVKGYMVDEIIRSQYPEINRVYANNIQDALKMVSRGQVFATVGSLLEMSYNIRQLGMLNLKITGDAKFEFNLGIGVKKGDKTLLSIIEKALRLITKQERNEILNKWISIKYQQGYNYSLVIKIVLVCLVIFAFIGGRAIITSKYNKKLLHLYNELLEAKNELQKVNRNLEIKVAEETSKRLDNERLLMQQSKLAAMGDMIGAIAHQWRQPLNAVAIIIQDIEDDFAAETATHESVKIATDEGMKVIMQMSQTITDFSNFFKPDKSSECFKLCKTINEVASMIVPQLKNHGIRLHMQCMDNDLDGKINSSTDPFDCCTNYCVHGYPNEFKHVILNILKNAMDALDNISIADKAININISTSKDSLITIAISDNGGGIKEEHAPRIFEPYFSTKMEGKGVGIGLYMSKQILENMNGKMWFKNENGGAVFYVQLQLCDHHN